MSQTQTAASPKGNKKKTKKAKATNGKVEVATPDAGGIYGDLAPEILNGVQMMRSRANELLLEMGRIELHKAGIVEEIEKLNSEANRLLQVEAQRLGIPSDTPWRMTPEGKAIAMEA